MDTALVSVIIPTCNNYELVLENISVVKQQTYPAIEIMVGDDSDINYVNANPKLIRQINEQAKYFYTAKFNHLGQRLYGLARARNKCIVEAKGEILVFIDVRIKMTNLNNIKLFVNDISKTKDKIWCFGDKGKDKISFVENFSAIRRSYCIDAGMFCEQIEKYGAMTRELIARYTHQGFTFKHIPNATATWFVESSDRDRKETEILEMREFLIKLGYAKPKIL